MDESKLYHSLINEALFTCQLLGAGVTQIRKANYSNKGMYFQAFNNLSIGFERFLKLCIIINYAIENNGTLIEESVLRKNFGHKLIDLFTKCSNIKEIHQFQFRYLNKLDNKIFVQIINVLNNFANGNRYSNISYIDSKHIKCDPIEEWHNNVDLFIYNNIISEEKKEVIKQKAQMAEMIVGSVSSVYYMSDSGSSLNDIKSASLENEIFEYVSPVRQFYSLNIIRYFIELLSNLGLKCRLQNNIMIPEFGEIFRMFNNNDHYLKSKKNWEKII